MFFTNSNLELQSATCHDNSLEKFEEEFAVDQGDLDSHSPPHLASHPVPTFHASADPQDIPPTRASTPSPIISSDSDPLSTCPTINNRQATDTTPGLILRASSVVSNLSSLAVIYALAHLTQTDTHPLGTEQYASVKWTVAGILALANRADLRAHDECTPEHLLTLLWILCQWDSQYNSSLNVIVERFTHLHPDRRAAAKKLAPALLALQLPLLQRCNWKLRLDMDTRLFEALKMLENEAGFAERCTFINNEAERLRTPTSPTISIPARRPLGLLAATTVPVNHSAYYTLPPKNISYNNYNHGFHQSPMSTHHLPPQKDKHALNAVLLRIYDENEMMMTVQNLQSNETEKRVSSGKRRRGLVQYYDHDDAFDDGTQGWAEEDGGSYEWESEHAPPPDKRFRPLPPDAANSSEHKAGGGLVNSLFGFFSKRGQ